MNSRDAKHSILYVIDGLDFGGGERVFLQLITALKERFTVLVAAAPGGRFEAEIKQLRLPFIPINMKKQISLTPIFQLRTIIRSRHVDLVHTQGARADFFGRVSGRISGGVKNICTIAMPVEGFDVSALRKTAYRCFDFMTESFVDRFIVVSDALKEMLIKKRKIDKVKVERIYNGIELDQYTARSRNDNLRKELGISEEIVLIGAVGRMVWQKGFEHLIRAIPLIIDKTRNARFLFVGDGPCRTDLEKEASDLQVNDKTIFAGFRSDIINVLSAIDILAVPSVAEGFPMLVLEAMAMEKPIIATGIDGIVEQLSHKKEGMLVPPANPEAIANAIVRMIQEDGLRKTLSAAARRKAERFFSVDEMVKETETVYLDLLFNFRDP